MSPDEIKEKHNQLAILYNLMSTHTFNIFYTLNNLQEEWKRLTGKLELEGFTGLKNNIDMGQQYSPWGLSR